MRTAGIPEKCGDWKSESKSLDVPESPVSTSMGKMALEGAPIL
jgi:hypothetical protein